MGELSNLLLDVYHLAREAPGEQFQLGALLALQKKIPFDAAKWGGSVVDEHGVSFHAPHLFNEPVEAQADYELVREQDICARQVIEHPGTTLNFRLNELYERARLPAIGGYVKRWAHCHALITAFIDNRRGTARSLSLYGAVRRRAFNEKARLLAQSVVPHMMQAWDINLATELGRFSATQGGRIWTVALADAAGFLLFSEDGFEELIQAQWPQSSRFTLPAPFKRDILDKGLTRFHGTTVVMDLRRAGTLYLVRARRRCSVDGLTNQQLQVARHVAHGLTHKEIAREMVLSPATVRNHLQAILSRTGARNNAELCAGLKAAGY